MRSDEKKVFLVAGEASADLHAAALLAQLKQLHPNLSCFGVGGPALAAQGMDIRADSGSLSVMGFTEWFDRAGEVIGTYRRIVRSVREERPDCAILLDLPDFNLRLARELKKIGVPVVYYISPQVWAWRRYRVHQIRKRVDRMLVVFPFEK